MSDSKHNHALERVLHLAEQVFRERGFLAVTMQDVAAHVGIRKASLYYYAPQGKEQLFRLVMQNLLMRYSVGIDSTLQTAPPNLAAQLLALAHYALSQPSLDLMRMIRSDYPALGEVHGQPLMIATKETFFSSVQRVITEAETRGEVRPLNAYFVAITFWAALEPLREQAMYFDLPLEVLAQELVDLLMKGMQP